MKELFEEIERLYHQAEFDLSGALGKSDSEFFEALGRRNALSDIREAIKNLDGRVYG